MDACVTMVIKEIRTVTDVKVYILGLLVSTKCTQPS